MRIKRKEAPERELAEARKKIEAHVASKLDRACCAKFENGSKECGKKYCVHHIRANAAKRVARVTRRLHESNHSSTRNLSVAAHLGVDILEKAIHVDPECRNSNLSDVECMSRSIIHHTAKKYGLDPQSVKEKAQAMGINMGKVLTHAAKATGAFTEMRSAGSGKKAGREKRRAEDASTASQLVQRARQKAAGRRGEGRRLAESGGSVRPRLPSPLGRQAVGVGAKAIRVGELQAARANASRTFDKGMKKVERAVLSSHSKVRERQHVARRMSSTSIYAQQFKTAARALSVGASAVQAEPGSIAGRFQGLIAEMGNLRDRYDKAMSIARKRRAEKAERRRRLERPADVSDVYDDLEQRVERRRRRRMQEGRKEASQVIHIPENHALSWLHSLVDWKRMLSEGGRLAGVERKRQEMRRKGVAYSTIVQEHPTGYWYLDKEDYSPTALGDAARRLHHRMEKGADPEWHERSGFARLRRRLQGPEGERHDSGRRVRRLAEAFLEGVVAAPFAFADTLLPSGETVPESGETFWTSTLRYVLYSSIGCYLMQPADEVSDTQLDTDSPDQSRDGEQVHVHRPRKDKLCFPGSKILTIEPLTCMFFAFKLNLMCSQSTLCSHKYRPSAS